MRISCNSRTLSGSSTARSHWYSSASRSFAISRAFMATGACASRPVIALAFAMPRLLFLRNTRLDLFFEPVPVQPPQKVFQLALFLLAKVLQVIQQPLRTGSRLPVALLQACLQ